MCRGQRSECGNLWPRPLAQVCAWSHSLWRVPFWCVRWIDHTHVRRIELLELSHLGIRKLEIINVEILLQVLERCGARDGANTLPDQLTHGARRCLFLMRLSNALKSTSPRTLAARNRAICDDRHAVFLAGSKHLVLIDKGMHLDLIADERLRGHRPGLVEQGGGE